MSAQYEADRAVSDERSDPLRAGKSGIRVVNENAPGQEKITRKEQSRIPVIKRHFCFVVARCRDGIDNSIPEVDLGEPVGPSVESVVAPDAVNIESNHLNIGQG